jgi:hypothetical protein
MHAKSRWQCYWGVQGTSPVPRTAARDRRRPRNESRTWARAFASRDVLDPFGNVLGIIENPNFKPNETK